MGLSEASDYSHTLPYSLLPHTSTFSLLSPFFSPDIPSPHSSPLASPGQSVPSASAVLTVLVLIHGAEAVFSCSFIIFSSIQALVLLSHALPSLPLFLTVSKTRQKDFRPRSSACFSHSSPPLALFPPFSESSRCCRQVRSAHSKVYLVVLCVSSLPIPCSKML